MEKKAKVSNNRKAKIHLPVLYQYASTSVSPQSLFKCYAFCAKVLLAAKNRLHDIQRNDTQHKELVFDTQHK
jgi:hypothetical protein